MTSTELNGVHGYLAGLAQICSKVNVVMQGQTLRDDDGGEDVRLHISAKTLVHGILHHSELIDVDGTSNMLAWTLW